MKGGSYSGLVAGTMTPTKLTFEVSQNGKKVTNVAPKPTFPLACGAFSSTKYVSKPAKIKGGSFKAKVRSITDTGSKLPAGTVKGTFGKHKKEAGTLQPIKAVGSSCFTVFHYKTKAK